MLQEMTAGSQLIRRSALLASETDFVSLESRLGQSLARRFQDNPDYQPAELPRLAEYKTNIFPEGYELSCGDSEPLRTLARLALTDLRPASAIKSHRPVLGPFIVALKKLSWPFIAIHLRDTFAALREFHARLLIHVASQQAQIDELKKRLK
jgi:hypothetical protein